VTLGELAEAFSDAAMEVCGNPEEARLAAALSLREFLRAGRGGSVPRRFPRPPRWFERN